MDIVALAQYLTPAGVLVIIVVYLLLRAKRNGNGSYPTPTDLQARKDRASEIDRRFDSLASQVTEVRSLVITNNDYFMAHIQNVAIHHPHEASAND